MISNNEKSIHSSGSKGQSRASLKRKRKSLSPQKTNNLIEKEEITTSENEKFNETNATFLDLPVTDIQETEDIDMLTFSLIDSFHTRDLLDNISSYQRSSSIFSAIIHPISRNEFYSTYWDKKPINFPKHNKSKWIEKFLSKKVINKFCDEHMLILGDDVIHDQFDNSNEEEGIEISSKELWRLFDQEKSVIKFLRLQQYIDNMWHLLYNLESEFSTTVDCMTVISPISESRQDSFIELGDSFIIQLEGSSLIKIYDKNSSDSSSKYLKTILHSGDSLYIPKGWKFKRSTPKSATIPSLHLHMICNMGNTYQKYIDLLIPQAIENITASHEHPINHMLPRNYLTFMGVASSENDEDQRRRHIQSTLKSLLNNVIQESMQIVDAASDQIAKQFLLERLPPPIHSDEESLTAVSIPDASIYPYTKVRLLRPSIARALIEDGMVVVYHCLDNARIRYGAVFNPLEFELDDGPAIEILLNAYPDSITVDDLPHPSEELDDKIGVAQALFKEGILVIVDEASKPSHPGDDSDDSDAPF